MQENRESNTSQPLTDERESVELKTAPEPQNLAVVVAPLDSASLSTPPVSWPEKRPESGKDDGSASSAPATNVRERSKPAGMRRHQLVLGATGLVAATVFALNVFNLRPLISEDGFLDRNFNFKPSESAIILPYGESSEGGELREGLIPFTKFSIGAKTVGFADAQGQTVIPPVYDQVKNFYEGRAAVKMPGEKGKWGYIDHSGKMVIPAVYTDVNSFDSGFAFVSIEDKSLVIDRDGKDCLPPDCSEVKPVRGGYFLVENGTSRLWGLLKGHQLLMPQTFSEIERIPRNYEERIFSSQVENFGESPLAKGDVSEHVFFKVLSNGLWGLADSNGKLLFGHRFKDVYSVNNGRVLFSDDGLEGFADMTGKVVIPPQFDQATGFDDLIAVRKGSAVSFIDSSGKPVKAAPVDTIAFNKSTFKWLHDGRGIFKRNGLYGYLDRHGVEVIPPKFKDAHLFEKGVALVLDGSRWKFIDTSGKTLTKANFLQAARFVGDQARVTKEGPLYSGIQEFPREVNESHSSSPVKNQSKTKQSEAFEDAAF